MSQTNETNPAALSEWVGGGEKFIHSSGGSISGPEMLLLFRPTKFLQLPGPPKSDPIEHIEYLSWAGGDAFSRLSSGVQGIWPLTYNT